MKNVITIHWNACVIKLGSLCIILLNSKVLYAGSKVVQYVYKYIKCIIFNLYLNYAAIQLQYPIVILEKEIKAVALSATNVRKEKETVMLIPNVKAIWFVVKTTVKSGIQLLELTLTVVKVSDVIKIHWNVCMIKHGSLFIILLTQKYCMLYSG